MVEYTVLRVAKLTSINEQLLKIEVIDQESIKEIREQISIQYQSLTSKERARLLAKTIYDRIDSSLPNFSAETKRSIRMELLKKNLSNKTLSISANDIIESSIELATQDELEKELKQWVHEKVEIGSDIDEFQINDLLSYQKKSETIVKTEVFAETGIHNQENVISINQGNLSSRLGKHKFFTLGAGGIVLVFLIIILGVNTPTSKTIEQATAGDLSVAPVKERMPNELPPYLQYEQIDEKKLREWLNGRNSLLADEPYFSTIIEVSSEFNINPLLLFAITGQEQGFVSKDNKNALKIANNPFNVYHSWEDFNTNILQSSQIAARTIVNLSKDRPDDADPIHWINRKYAEDKNWWRGVSVIFKQLEGAVK